MNEESLFAAALEKPTPAEREAFLDEACGGDVALRQRLERLLAADRQTVGILEHCPDPAAGEASPPPPPLAPDHVFAGRFQLLRKLGAGGMGEVWVADQTEGVRRRVALKVVRAGLDSARLLARFEAERQALALMDHPNIARVLDAGVADGRPYFVMELIEGVPITDYCDAHRLSLRERLELLLPVCHAVQHAHQKGIIHRDLKPSNILVARYDGKPAPRVIDFGVAKATGPRLTEQSVCTEVGVLVGTLEYMSPEQAELNNLDIDTRSDIYALGVVLYELLTGSVPFTRRELQAVALTEMLRTIQEVDPPKPSTKLSGSPALADVAAVRQTEPKRLVGLVRGELDWIVMKCLEKDRARRYDTADGLALDLRRYQADEPVQAGPPSAGYRLRKFVKRHRGPVLAATVVLLALAAGVVGTTLGLVEADAARKDAEAKGAKAREAEGKAKELAKEEKAARARAEWLLYASQISLSLQAWEGANVGLAWHYLDLCRPDHRGWEHDYLCTLFHSNQRTFGTQRTDGKGRVSSVAVSPDGKRIVSGDDDGAVKVWDAETGQEVLTIKQRGSLFTSVAWSPDRKRIVSASTSGTLSVWNAETGREALTLRDGYTGPVHCVAWSPDGKHIVGGSQGIAGKSPPRLRDGEMMRVWDADTGKLVLKFKGDAGTVRSVAYSPDGKHFVGGGTAQTVKVWDATTGAETLTLKGHTNTVTSVAFSPDGKHLVSGSDDQTVKVWDTITGQEIRSLTGHTGPVYCVAFSPDGKHILSGSWDQTVNVWDATTGAKIRTLKGHIGQVRSIAVMPDGRRLVSGSDDATVKVWDMAVAQGPRALKGNMAEAMCVALMPDSKRVLRGGLHSVLEVRDPDTGGASPRALGANTGTVSSVAVMPDGKRIVSGDSNKAVKIWDADTGQEIRALNGHTKEVTSVAVSPDGRRLVSSSRDQTVKVWDAETGQESLTLKGHTGWVMSVAVSPDGRRLVSGSRDQTVKVWDAETGQAIRALNGHTGGVTSVAWSSDGKCIVSGSEDKTVKVWDADTGQEIHTLTGHTGPVSSIAVLPDRTRIVSGSWDQTVKVWDAETGQETLTLKGQTNVVTSVAVSPDGKRIVSGSTDGTVLVWDAGRSQRNP